MPNFDYLKRSLQYSYIFEMLILSNVEKLRTVAQNTL